MKNHGVAALFLLPIMRTMVRRGLEWAVFCKHAALDPGLVYQEEARIAEDEFVRVVQAAADFTGDHAFGLHQGQEMNLSDLGVPGYVMLHSKTIGKAMEAYQNYNLIVCNNFTVAMEEQGQDVTIRLLLGSPGQQPGRHCVEDMAASLYHTCRKTPCFSYGDIRKFALHPL